MGNLYAPLFDITQEVMKQQLHKQAKFFKTNSDGEIAWQEGRFEISLFELNEGVQCAFYDTIKESVEFSLVLEGDTEEAINLYCTAVMAVSSLLSFLPSK